MTKNDEKWWKTRKNEKNLKNRKKTRTLKVSRIYGDLSLKYGAFFSCFFDLFFVNFHDFSCFFEFFHLFSSFYKIDPPRKMTHPWMYVCIYIYICPPPIFTGGVKFWEEIFGSKYFYFIILFLFYIFYFYNFIFFIFIILNV